MEESHVLNVRLCTFIKIYLFFVNKYVPCQHVCLCGVHAHRSEDGVRCPGTVIVNGYEPRGCWQWTLGSLQERPMILTTEHSLQLCFWVFNWCFVLFVLFCFGRYFICYLFCRGFYSVFIDGSVFAVLENKPTASCMAQFLFSFLKTGRVLLHSSGWPGTFTCFCLPHTGIEGIQHHARFLKIGWPIDCLWDRRRAARRISVLSCKTFSQNNNMY